MSFHDTIRQFPSRLAATLAAALVAMVMAAPVWAQTTITAPGLEGQPACAGGYVDNSNGNYLAPSTSIPNGSGTMGFFTNNFSSVSYTFLRGRLGGDSGISSFPMRLRIINTRTGSEVGTEDLGTVTSTNPVARATSNFSLTEKTPYVAIYYADVTGQGVDNPISRFCFMTGGTYTIGTLEYGGGQTNGCFSISPRTPQDVRNCLCGRPTTGAANSVFSGSQEYDYTSFRPNWGCDSAE